MSGHEHTHSHTQASQDLNAGAQQQLAQLVRMQGNAEAQAQSTMLPVESRPDLPPNIRNWTRWEYLEEYIGFWKYEHVTRMLGIIFLALGFLCLPYFTPGALLMIAVAGRYLDLAWWYNFIVHKFGNN